jgi:TolB-like protein/Tfp pilus assembly protein PilF
VARSAPDPYRWGYLQVARCFSIPQWKGEGKPVEGHSASSSRAHRLLMRVREHLSHAVIGGTVILLTGFAPEHWVAEALHSVRLPGWFSGFDLRLAIVSLGVAIIVGDILWWQHARRPEPSAGTDMAGRATGTRVSGPAPASLPELELPNKPSIAVLPFTNLSGDPEQEYFVDGVVEDIITALSRMRWLFVIARNSSFTYKGRAVDVKQVGRELGVRYVLEGSVRKASERLRISGQLIDASTGAHLWADRFEGAPQDIFDLQDQVALNVVGAVGPKLEQAEIERAKRKPTESLDAYDYYLRGAASLYRWTKENNREALRLFKKALELDPEFASAYAAVAWCYIQRKASGWMEDSAQETADTARLARRAADLGKDDATALSYAGAAFAYVVHDLERGADLIERALALNPNLAAAWLWSGWIKIWQGEPDVAIEHLKQAMRLSPLDPRFHTMQSAMAHAHFLAERFGDASLWAGMALREWPDLHSALRIVAASHALARRIEDAKKALERLRRVDPGLRVSSLKEALGPYRPQDLARYEEGLRQAGLPE